MRPHALFIAPRRPPPASAFLFVLSPPSRLRFASLIHGHHTPLLGSEASTLVPVSVRTFSVAAAQSFYGFEHQRPPITFAAGRACVLPVRTAHTAILPSPPSLTRPPNRPPQDVRTFSLFTAAGRPVSPVATHTLSPLPHSPSSSSSSLFSPSRITADSLAAPSPSPPYRTPTSSVHDLRGGGRPPLPPSVPSTHRGPPPDEPVRNAMTVSWSPELGRPGRACLRWRAWKVILKMCVSRVPGKRIVHPGVGPC